MSFYLIETIYRTLHHKNDKLSSNDNIVRDVTKIHSLEYALRTIEKCQFFDARGRYVAVAETLAGNTTSMFPINFRLSVFRFLQQPAVRIRNCRDGDKGICGRFVIIVRIIFICPLSRRPVSVCRFPVVYSYIRRGEDESRMEIYTARLSESSDSRNLDLIRMFNRFHMIE